MTPVLITAWTSRIKRAMARHLVGAHNSVVGADQGLRAPSRDLMCRILDRFLALLARLAVRSGRSKDLEIIVLRHQLGVLRRRNNRPQPADEDRALLGAVAGGPAPTAASRRTLPLRGPRSPLRHGQRNRSHRSQHQTRRAPPIEPRRQPPAQQSPPHRRHRPDPRTRHRGPRLLPALPATRQDQTRSDPRPQTAHLRPHLDAPPTHKPIPSL